jgi:transcriptional regulator with XRE-family HTH domain
MSQIGSIIQGYRVNKGLSQRDLAKATGMSQQTIAAYEVGRRKPPDEALRRIAEALGVSMVAFAPDAEIPPKRELPQLPEQKGFYQLSLSQEVFRLFDLAIHADEEDVSRVADMLEFMIHKRAALPETQGPQESGK